MNSIMLRLRTPTEIAIKEQIEELAKVDRRSQNQMVIIVLQAGLDSLKKTQ